MTRKTSMGNIYGEIYDMDGNILAKINTSFLGKIQVSFQNIDYPFEKKKNFFYDVFILNNGDKIKIFNFFLPLGRIYWNDKLISKIKYANPFKYNITLELEYKIDNDFQIYYSSFVYCITLLNVNLY